MQNVTLELQDSVHSSYPEALRSATSFLRRFSEPAIPRARCTIFLRPRSDKFLSEVSFLDSLGKLTAFKTVALELCGRMDSVQERTSEKLDAYLSVMLGPGELSFEMGDWRFGQLHRLTYHPCRRAHGMKGKENTN